MFSQAAKIVKPAGEKPDEVEQQISQVDLDMITLKKCFSFENFNYS